MTLYRSKNHPPTRPTLRGLSSLPPPEPPPQRRCRRPKDSRWYRQACREVRDVTIALYAAAYEFRRMRLEVDSW